MTTRADLKRFLDELKIRFLENPATVPVESIISDKIDHVLQEFWSEREPSRSFGLFAIGGYGRGAVHPQSDIDLLFFFKDGIDEEAIKRILHPLWDLQFKVGHQIRHADDFKEFDETHMESYTAFLDCRFLIDRKSTRLNSSHTVISYAVFCLKKKRERHSRHRPIHRRHRYKHPRSRLQ